MIELLVAASLAPWAHPLRFHTLAGWQTGASGNVPSQYGPAPVRAPRASSAWIAKNVSYRDRATEDPPNLTLARLPHSGVIVWAVIFQGEMREHAPIKLDLKRARYLPCCEGARVAGGVYELHGFGPRRKYTVYVRIYFGARPTPSMRAQAQKALGRLELPPLR